MTLMLHVNAKAVEYDGLRQLETPPATQTHVPIAHHRVVALVRSTVAMYGHEIVGEHHGITDDGARYFGRLSLRSTYGNYEDTVGLRNSHDKSFPIGIAFGSRVFVCDNMAFMADHVIKRRHTVNLKRDLPGLVGELIEPPGRPSRTTAPHLRALPAHDAHGRARRSRRTQHVPRGHIDVQRIPEVLKEWDAPTFEEFQTARSAWRLFNAATFALTGRVTDNPNATPKLHKVIDGVCN